MTTTQEHSIHLVTVQHSNQRLPKALAGRIKQKLSNDINIQSMHTVYTSHYKALTLQVTQAVCSDLRSEKSETRNIILCACSKSTVNCTHRCFVLLVVHFLDLETIGLRGQRVRYSHFTCGDTIMHIHVYTYNVHH